MRFARWRPCVTGCNLASSRRRWVTGTSLASAWRPHGAVVQIFLVRHGRVIDRLELVTDQSGPASPGTPGGPLDLDDERTLLSSAIQQFYADTAGAARDSTSRSNSRPTTVRRFRRGCRRPAGRRVTHRRAPARREEGPARPGGPGTPRWRIGRNSPPPPQPAGVRGVGGARRRAAPADAAATD